MKQVNYRYLDIAESTYAAAKIIVPEIVALIGLPKSIIDLGGGLGGWLKVFKGAGVLRVRLYDHPSAARETLLVSPEEFVGVDMDQAMPDIERCSLAISLEFAEHVPESRSDDIVRFLTACADAVLFSAAIPGQTGNGHINLQYPGYWQRKFAAMDFARFDVIRPRIIWNNSIPAWYRQNMFVFAKIGTEPHARLAQTARPSVPPEFEIVLAQWLETPPTFKSLLRQMPSAFARSLAFHAGKLLKR